MPEVESPAETDESAARQPVARTASAIDLGTRPESEWLAQVEGEVDDVDFVLKCLARDSDLICETCTVADQEGLLDQRPVLARCASTKQAR